MNHSLSVATLLSIALLALPGADVLAQTSEATLDKIARTGEFVMGYRADSSPLSYESANGEPSGYSVDLCRRISASIKAHFAGKNIDAKFIRISSEERISAVVDGRIDIECGATTITLSRLERVDFSLPTFVTGGSVLSLATTGIDSIADLSGKKIGVLRDTTTVEQLRSYLGGNEIDAELIIVKDRSEGMSRLNQGDIHALASDQIVLIGQVMKAPDPERYSIGSEIFSYEPYGLVVRRNDADFRLVVDRAISQLYRSGQHADIFYRWIGQYGIDVPPIVAAMYQLNALPE